MKKYYLLIQVKLHNKVNLNILLEKHLKNKHLQIKLMGKSKFKFYRFYLTNKELLPIKYFISDKKLNSEIVNELKRIEEEKQKVDRKKNYLRRKNKNTYYFTKFKMMHVFSSVKMASLQ